MAGGYDSFIHGSQIGGGQGTKQIEKNAKLFGDNVAVTNDSNSLDGVLARVAGGTGGGSDTARGLYLQSLMPKHTAKAGDAYTSTGMGLDIDGKNAEEGLAGQTIFQPGAISDAQERGLYNYEQAHPGNFLQNMRSDLKGQQSLYPTSSDSGFSRTKQDDSDLYNYYLNNASTLGDE